VLFWASVVLTAAGFATEVPETIRAKLAATNEVTGRFVQTKVDGSGREYVMRGSYRIRPGVDFTWRTEDPFETVFTATQSCYSYSNEDCVVSRALSDLPGAGRFAAASAGDVSAFFKAFDALYKEEGGKFYVKAKPKVGELSSVLERVDAEGTVSNWTLSATFPNRTRIAISFRDD